MPRRMTHLAAASVAAAALTLTSCAASESPDEPFELRFVTEVPAATAAVENVRWNLPEGEPTTLDPAVSVLESGMTVVSNMCEALLTRTSDGEAQPGLATAIEQPNDNTYVFTLREGVTFWDGSPMTPDDVVFSILRLTDPALGGSTALTDAGEVTATVTGENEVTMTVEIASPLIQQYFATLGFAVLKKDYVESAGDAFGKIDGGLMCTGPYKLVSWDSGKSIVIERNDDWWNTDVDPLVEQVSFSFTTDTAAITSALLTGEIEGSWGVPSSQYKKLDGQGNLLFNDSLGLEMMPVLNFDGPLADVKIRQALAASINYEGITEKILLGAGEPLRSIVPSSAWGYSREIFAAGYDALTPAEQDLERAKELVEEADYDGSPIGLAYSGGAEDESKMATIIADDAKKVGLNIELMPLEPAQFAAIFGDDPEAREGMDIFLTNSYLDFPEPAAQFQFFTTTSFYNFGGYSNPEFDEAMARALAEFDDDARATDVVAAQATMAADAAVLPLYSDFVNVYYSEDLAGLVPSPARLYAPWIISLGGK